ncbi:hypothetical protein AMATHDRAFT_143422 [Amanita thiersii Skay4041]|uniref:Ubiquitin carboxyl-terminal hydrolase n=1 Tax=Amanita thiersii Skay4041 TaxID=703135 RepID=A0A2A9NS43_9AGAR|nr:hypothetical protein AMATHDRAFT_143422 [Amanita thiersii Skay4041]
MPAEILVDNICSHLVETFADESSKESILDKFKTAIRWYVNRYQVVTNSNKRRKVASPTCGTCHISLFRPFVCLHCDYAGCWTDQHIAGHLRDECHQFCADAKTGATYCSECEDFIYDPILRDVYSSTILSMEEKHTRFQVLSKRREPFQSWVPSEKDNAALEQAPPVPCQGRRGLLNLGQTCFFNVILQSFVHNPLLRNYFLGDKHNWRQCKTENCTCCEMDKLFAEIYSDDNSTPYGPHTFLATTWRASAELAGYAQQDAHEFFISALNQIHATSRGSTEVSCNCIIHSTFAGQLQSDVKCERCGNVTSTVDPMLDISLELKGIKNGSGSSTRGSPTTLGTGDNNSNNNLAACLRRFTQPEKLGPKEYSCSKCAKSSHEASKRLSIRKLPPVLSFQFKRFEHKGLDKSSSTRKIESQIRFPATLNMAPYTTLYMRKSEKENNNTNNGSFTSYPGPDSIYEYDLFAVINHEGQMNNGHYTNFARFGDEWYRFDDDKVTHTTLGACLKSAAYMCFYVKRHLDYKPHMTPSYVRAREAEAAKERELEKEKEAARIKELEDALLATV